MELEKLGENNGLEQLIGKCVWKQLAHSTAYSSGWGKTEINDPCSNSLYYCRYECDGTNKKDCYIDNHIGQSNYEK